MEGACSRDGFLCDPAAGAVLQLSQMMLSLFPPVPLLTDHSCASGCRARTLHGFLPTVPCVAGGRLLDVGCVRLCGCRQFPNFSEPQVPIWKVRGTPVPTPLWP